MRFETVKRSALDALAGLYGIKRRWFGLEPDFMLRRRTYAAIIPRKTVFIQNCRECRIKWWDVFFVSLVIVIFVAASALLFMLALTEPIV